MKYILAALIGVFVAMGVARAYAQVVTQLYQKETYPQAYCLAQNIYFEARGSNLADKAAVADVVLDRVKDSRFPNTVCEVVYQGKQKPSWKDPNKMVMVRHQCQFSWYCDGKSDEPTQQEAWVQAQQIAYLMIYFEEYKGISEGATHYHATYVDPHWAKQKQLVGRIGSHIFYRWE